jgi:hypothetical protein
MNWSATASAILVAGLLAAGRVSRTVPRGNSTPRPPLDTGLSVGGLVLVTNDVRVSRRPLLCVSLLVTNMTSADIYVPKHFNSNNYTFKTDDESAGEHGDSWAATFEDFVLLKPHEAMEFTFTFAFYKEVGEGLFSVHFYNNLRPEVERQLKATGIAFIIELSHSFGSLSVRASNKTRNVENAGAR